MGSTSECEPSTTDADPMAAKFVEISHVLFRTHSTLIIDPMLASIADTIEATGNIESVKPALLWAVQDRSNISGRRSDSSRDRPDDGYAFIEIISYLGFRFRWPWLRRRVEDEFLDAAERWDLRAMRFFERILESFDDGWEDRDLFPSLGG